MAKNEFAVQRTAYGSFTLANGSASSVHTTGVRVPAGAIVTNIRFISPGAVTKTGASGTVVPRIGTDNIAATVNVSALPAQTVMATTAVAANYVANGGEFQLVEGASSNSAATGTYEFYVDYLYVN